MANLIWKYKDKSIANLDDLAQVAGHSIDKLFGIIYGIEFEGNKFYIGKKDLWFQRELKPLQNGEKRNGHVAFINRIVDHKKTKMELVKVESDWLTYTGSCIDTHGLKPIRKKILEVCLSRRQLTYRKNFWLFRFDVLENDKFLNSNIGGKFFRGNLA